MHLIGLHGLKRSGKSTVARYLVDQYGFGEVSFAAPLKRGLASMLGLDIGDLEREDYKEAEIGWLGRSPRYLMQTLGSDWARQLVNERIWIILAGRAIDRHRHMGMPGCVVSDVRFDNEAEFILQGGGQLWTIVRPVRAAESCDKHPSELGISTAHPTRGIVNHPGFHHLYKRVDELLAPLGAAVK